MNLAIAVVALLVGYAFGCISFTRLMARRLKLDGDISRTSFDLPGTDKQFVMTSVSATTIFARAGARRGCLVALLDVAKGFIPVMAFRLLFPGELYFLPASIGAVAGHNFPVQYGFKGGRGMATLTGSMLAIDWVAVPVLLVLSVIIGFGILRDAMGFYATAVVLSIPWMWFQFGTRPYILTAVIYNVIFFAALLPELRQYIALKRSGVFAEVAAYTASQPKPEESFLMRLRRSFGLVKQED
jgi:acyl-phosphate glycerol 3-phosphate acyltransferase